jgi:gamma-D-glutamyl-L-lysine dipeptidyl-peptidase
MKTGFCNLAVVAMRSQPSEKAEMVSQILFGEKYSILDIQSKWALIQTHFDGYEGWINLNQIEYFEDLKQSNDLTQISAIAKIKTFDNRILRTSFGSNLFSGNSEGSVPYTIIDGAFTTIEKFEKAKIVSFASMFLNVPYLWGGRSIFGLDCSGFTQIVFKAAGFNLKRDASLQAGQGIAINFIQEAEPGDLVFFDNEEGQIVHVGILFDSKTVIHASGHVRFDSIDHHGIFNEKLGKYTHSLRIIKRI